MKCPNQMFILIQAITQWRLVNKGEIMGEISDLQTMLISANERITLAELNTKNVQEQYDDLFNSFNEKFPTLVGEYLESLR